MCCTYNSAAAVRSRGFPPPTVYSDPEIPMRYTGMLRGRREIESVLSVDNRVGVVILSG